MGDKSDSAGAGPSWHADRRRVVQGAAAASAIALAAGLRGVGHAQAPTDRLTFRGPIPVTTDSKPWGSAMDGGPREALVRHYGYVEEEYFASGLANVYGPGNRTPARPGQSADEFAKQLQALAAFAHPDVPFTTRATMLRPRELAKFSGNVHLLPLPNLDGTTHVE